MMTTTNTTGAATVDGTIFVEQIKSKDLKRGGRVYPGEGLEGHHAIIVPGKSVTLHGVIRAGARLVKDAATGRYAPTTRPVMYDRHFEIGDTACVGGYNLTYMGTITKITAKQVWVEERVGSSGGKLYKMDLATFDRLNWDFDAEAACERNANWRD